VAVVAVLIILALVGVFIFRGRKKETRSSQIVLFKKRESSNRPDTEKPIPVLHFVLGVNSNAFPVRNEFDWLLDADVKYNTFKFSSSVGRSYTASNWCMNR
jgi:hypothetical protein